MPQEATHLCAVSDSRAIRKLTDLAIGLVPINALVVIDRPLPDIGHAEVILRDALHGAAEGLINGYPNKKQKSPTSLGSWAKVMCSIVLE